MDEEKNEKKELEVVDGDGTELNISPAYEHLNDATPQDMTDNKPKNIVVPKEMSIVHKEANDETNKDDSESDNKKSESDEN